MADDTRILQIMPADGWYAVIADEEGENQELESVACFALVEMTEEGEVTQLVRPMYWADGMIEFCDEADGFTGIVRAGDTGDEEDTD